MATEQYAEPGQVAAFTLRRVLRSFSRHVRDRREYLILEAGAYPVPPPLPQGTLPLRVTIAENAGQSLAEQAMQEASEPPEVTQRLSQRHEFFALREGPQVLCFGWACFRERHVGLYHYPERPGQVFFYNFYTQPSHRGRGLYPALLLHMRYVFGGEGYQRFLIDVRTRNQASIRGIRKAGFSTVRRVGYDTWLGRWQRELDERTIPFAAAGPLDAWTER